MMLGIVVYWLLAAMLIGLAGLVAERILAWHGLPRRGIWAVTLALSVSFPLAMMLLHRTSAVTPTVAPAVTLVQPSPHPTKIVTRPAEIATLVRAMTLPMNTVGSAASPTFDRLILRLWVSASAILLGSLLFSWINLRRLRDRWRRSEIDYQAVWVTPDLGPAVCGIFKPIILLPAWLLEVPSAIRVIVLAHEREHIRALDPLLLALGFLCVLVLPWNLPIWWQWCRLRFAVEVDCDFRALKGGVDTADYGNVLLMVSQRQRAAPLGAMSMAPRASRLERRVQIMTSARTVPRRWLVGAAACVSLACVAFAAQLSAPGISRDELVLAPWQDTSPFLAKAESAARAAYPNLFQGQFDGTMSISVDLNRDGVVLNMQTHAYAPGPLTDASFGLQEPEVAASMETLSDDAFHKMDAIGAKFEGWFGRKRDHGLYLYYKILKWRHDPARSSARVRTAVEARYPEFFKSYAEKNDTQTAITLVMNDDGTINRDKLVTPIDWNTFFDRRGAREQRFLELGLTTDQLSHEGTTRNINVFGESRRFINPRGITIEYAWPRRPGDPPYSSTLDENLPQTQPTPIDQYILQQMPVETVLRNYFPDVWQNGPVNPDDEHWLLLGPRGDVWSIGVGLEDPVLLTAELEARFPGVLVQFFLSAGAKTISGREARLSYFWLREDSPIQSRQAIGFSQVPDTLIRVDAVCNDITMGQKVFALRYNHASDEQLSAGGRAWVANITARDAGIDAVDVQMRMQSVVCGGHFDPTADYEPGPTIRVPYGNGESSMTYPDANHQTWRFKLSARRFNLSER